jgi:hypothetical protein
MTLNNNNEKNNHDWVDSIFGRFQFRGVIALLVVVASFGFLFALLFVPIPEQNKETTNVTIGFVLVTLGIVIGYYFGTSKDTSDQTKTKNVSDLMKAGGPQNPATKKDTP